jgi:ABC-type transport system involved in multi-copper enzyme maturation permease subunit
MAAKASAAGGRSRPGSRPIAWKEFRFLVGGYRGLLVRLLGLFAGLGVMYGAVLYDRGAVTTDRDWGVVLGGWALICLAAIMADSLFLATRLLNEELKWNTLGNLLLLPKNTASVVLGKLLGASTALIPAIVCGLVALALYAQFGPPNEVREALPALISPMAWAFVAGWLLYLAIVAYLSTVVRYGATVLAVIVYVVGGYALAPVLLVAVAMGGMTDSEEVAAVPIAAVLAALTVGAVALCVKRFESLGER